MAAVAVLVTELAELRKLDAALRIGKRAAWMKLATAGSIEQARNFSLQFEAIDNMAHRVQVVDNHGNADSQLLRQPAQQVQISLSVSTPKSYGLASPRSRMNK